MTFSASDALALRHAKNVLENPGLTAQLTGLVGAPIEMALKRLPNKVHEKLSDVLETTLLRVANSATRTMDQARTGPAATKRHTLGAAVSGGVGGFFGGWAILAEVPVTTGIIFRSIADIARAQGESIRDEDTILACVEVFALGGNAKSDDAAESGYYAARTAIAQQVKSAAEFVAKAGTDKAAPALVALIRKVVERLGVVYTEKLAAQIVPVIGAVGGASVNVLFMSHFQKMAHAHFTIRRLERTYGSDVVSAAYAQLPRKG